MRKRQLVLLFASYVVPTVLAMFISGAYQIIDGFFIGHFVGNDGLAAGNIGWSYITILLGLGLMMGIGTGSLYSLAKGEEDEERALNILGQSIFMIFVLGMFIGISLYQAAPFLVGILHANENASTMAIKFIRVFALSSPLVIGSLAMPFIVRNVGSPTRSTVYMAIGVSFNILFSFILIVMLHLEVFGAALASVIGETIAMLLGLYFIIKQSGEPLQLRHFIPRFKLIGAITLNGSSAFFMYIYVGFIMMLHHKMLVIHGGTLAVSAYTITGYLLTVYYFAVEGVANGIQPIISKLYGSQRVRSTRFIIRLMVIVGLGLGIIITGLLQIFPGFFASWFTTDPKLQTEAIHAIRFNLSLLFLEGVFVLATIFFQAIGEGQKALFISIGNLLIQVPFLFILPIFLELNGVWLTMPIASFILSVPIGIMMFRRYRKIV